MKQVSTDTLFLPQKDSIRLPAGKTFVEWDVAVIYVRNRHDPYDPPTHLLFSCFGCSGDYYVTEALACVDQWTWYRGRCERVYLEDEHEFRRARLLACQVIETYRRNYMRKHGAPPNPLLLNGTLNPAVHDHHTAVVNRRLLGERYGQLKLDLPT